MADNAGNFGVGELLRDQRPLFRLGLIVLRLELKSDWLPAYGDALRVEFVDRQLGAVLVILAVVSLRPGKR